MGILDKVKNSKIAKTAAKKANEYMNSDENKNQGSSSKSVKNQNPESKQKMNQ